MMTSAVLKTGLRTDAIVSCCGVYIVPSADWHAQLRCPAHVTPCPARPTQTVLRLPRLSTVLAIGNPNIHPVQDISVMIVIYITEIK